MPNSPQIFQEQILKPFNGFALMFDLAENLFCIRNKLIVWLTIFLCQLPILQVTTASAFSFDVRNMTRDRKERCAQL